MSHSDPSKAEGVRKVDPSEDGGGGAAVELPPAARRSLDDIASALGVTSALLGRPADGADPREPGAATLAEASALLRAFIQIDDRQARERCLAFVRRAAEEAPGP